MTGSLDRRVAAPGAAAAAQTVNGLKEVLGRREKVEGPRRPIDTAVPKGREG